MKHLFLLTTLLALLTSCKDNKIVTPTDTDQPGPEITLGSFPMQIGHTWIYDNGDTIKAVSDSTINGISTRKLEKRNGRFYAAAYYANSTNGWQLVAASSPQMFNIFTDPISPDSSGTTLLIPDEPALITKLPILVANEWAINVPTVTNYTRKWLGFYTVVTPAGTFDCVKLYTGTAFEYYSAKGIVKTEHVVVCVTAPCPLPAAKLVSVNF